MTPEDLQRQLSGTGVVCKIKRDEVVVETCRFCGNSRWNLELNAPAALFHCWSCNAGGRLDALLREWIQLDVHLEVRVGVGRRRADRAPTLPGTFAAVPAFDVLPCARYLERRFISREVAVTYELVVCTDATHPLANRLAIPVRDFWTGIVIGYQGRTFTGQHPKYLSTLRERVIGGYRQRSWQTPCVVVEGMFDAIAIHRAGLTAAALLGISAPRLMEFAGRLHPDAPLVVMLDGEARAEAERLRWTIQPARQQPVVLTPLPAGRDPAELLPEVLATVVRAGLTSAVAGD